MCQIKDKNVGDGSLVCVPTSPTESKHLMDFFKIGNFDLRKIFFQKQVHNLWSRGKFCFRFFLPLARIAEKNSRLSDSLEAVQGAIDPPDPTLVLPLTANDFLYTRQAGTNGEECNTNSRLS